MNKLISSKTIALTFGVLVLCFLAVFYVVAWTEPTVAPPGDNVSAPLNVSDTPQTKEGALTIEAGGGESLILKNGGDIRIYNPDNSGSALLYVDNDGEITTQGNLKVEGDMMVGTVAVKGDGSESTNLNSEKLQGYHAEELMAAAESSATGVSGGSLVTWGYGGDAPGQGAPACPSGHTEVYAGYGPYWATYAGVSMAVSTHCGLSKSQTVYLHAGSYFTSSACSNTNTCNTCRVCVQTGTGGEIGSGSTVIYVAPTTYNGNLGGRSGANAKCSSGLPATLIGKVSDIKAFISVSATDEIRDLHNNDSDSDGNIGPYESNKRVYVYNRLWGKYIQIAADWQDLLDGSINQPLSNSGFAGNWWTGTSYYGDLGYRSCDGWTTSSGSVEGIYGSLYYTNTTWLYAGYEDMGCGSSIVLFCVAKVI